MSDAIDAVVKSPISLDIRGILEHLPHRYPMLLVDRVLDIVPGQSIHAIKNVSINEAFFAGHFPHIPVMPGVLMIEALAQAAGILSFQTMGQLANPHSVFYFVGIDGARFKRPVGPGDQLHLQAQARVDDQLAVEAELMCTMRKVDSEKDG
jgi:3-hydroxyacyl-[acyl-carrier-protein] dehydratase